MKAPDYPAEFFLIILTTLSVFLAYNLTLPILPLHLVALGADSLQIGAIAGILYLTMTFTKLPFGMIAQRSRMIGGLAFAAFGQSATQFFYSISPSPDFFYLIQIFHGITIAPLVAIGIAASQKFAPFGKRGEAMGLYLSGYGIAGTTGPMLCSFLLFYLDYQQLFLVAASIPIIGFMPSVIVKSRISKEPPEEFNQSGSFSQLKEILRSQNMRILSVLRFLNALIFGFFGAFFVIHAGMNLLLSASIIAFMLGAMGAADLVARFPLGSLLDRVSYKWVLTATYTFLAVLYYLLSECIDAIALTLVLTLIGFASGVRITSEWTMSADNSPKGTLSITSGFIATIVNVGRGIGSFIGGLLVLLTSIPFVFKLVTIILVISTVITSCISSEGKMQSLLHDEESI